MQNLRFRFPILTILVIAFSCSTEPKKTNRAKNHFDTLTMPSDSSEFYFLSKNAQQDTAINSLDTFVNSWYSKMLFALKEPILNNYKGDKEIYRFTWLRTFHHPVSVRIEKQSNIIRVFAKVSNGAGGYEPGKIIVDTTFDVTVNEWTNFTKTIGDAGFWQMPTESKDEDGKDGSEWIIEGVKDSKYHMVTRWSPAKGNFRSIGETLITISKIKGETKNYY